MCDDWREALASQRHASTSKTRAGTPDCICHASRSNRDCLCRNARGTRDGKTQVAPLRSSRGPAPHVKNLGTRTPATRLRFTPFLTLTRAIRPRMVEAHVRMSPQRVARPRATVAGVLTDVAWFGFKLGFGLISLASVWATAVLKNGVLGAKDTEEEKRELAIAQENFWSLDREPIPGFRHAFFTTSTGARLHYVTNAEGNSAVSKNVGIFIHGLSLYNAITASRQSC
jgi:hypothetical protein